MQLISSYDQPLLAGTDLHVINNDSKSHNPGASSTVWSDSFPTPSELQQIMNPDSTLHNRAAARRCCGCDDAGKWCTLFWRGGCCPSGPGSESVLIARVFCSGLCVTLAIYGIIEGLSGSS